MQVPVFADILGLSGANCMRPISKSYDGRREQYENPAPQRYSMPLLNWKGMILALPAFAAHADDRRAGSHLKRLLNW